MKKIILAVLAMAFLLPASGLDKKVNVYDAVVFYDGYRDEVVDSALNDGVLRFSNSHYSVKLDSEELADVGDSLQLEVVIGALCDNYDRIGNLNLAFVPKGALTYVPEEVDRIELTRFITPFMNKNKTPDEVPYSYSIPNVGKIFRDADITAKYDFWMEFELFGIPYDANKKISGCEDRNDVFDGTVNFIYDSQSEPVVETGNVIVPVYIKAPENRGSINLNNYNELATDTIGKTTRTFEFFVPQDVADARVYLILTNHGAGERGEEYVRRLHFVYFDDEVVLSYTPGGVSCEPYRKYNTQSNGIYSTYRAPNFWTQYSNWCPGQAVPIREIPLGPVKAGTHKVMIRVPDAVFYKEDGDFRPSLYFHGVTQGNIEAGVDAVWMEGPEISVRRDGDILRFSSSDEIASVAIHSYDGRLLRHINIASAHSASENVTGSIDVSGLARGPYIVTFLTPEGRTTSKSLLL